LSRLSHLDTIYAPGENTLSMGAPSRSKPAVFKLFVGYAPGVGKTYNMLSEALRRRDRGEDVAIGVIETHGRKPIAELARQLETIPRRKLEYRGKLCEEADVDAIIARKPQVVLVDELAHTNTEGSKHGKRYEDVLDILEANIDVLSTLNIQHIESLTPIVLKITGIQVRETVPDWFLRRVDEIVMADLTPQALQSRMARGDIYPLERAQLALSHFFRAGNLIALRELALQQVAGVVDRSLEAFRREEGQTAPAAQERIAVAVNASPSALFLIARAARMATAVGGQLFVVHVDVEPGDRHPEKNRWLEENLRFARNLRAIVVELAGSNVAATLAHFVRENHITQMVFGHSARAAWQRYIYLSTIHRFLRDAPAVNVHIITQQPR
jgi:two-component system, OmpR family, sensor histidine kinase KdpD